MNEAALAVVLSAVSLSPGPGHSICGRAVYDRARAAAGGAVLVADQVGPGDHAALRASEALLTTRRGYSSPGAALARRHSLPAVAVPGAYWRDGLLVVPAPGSGPLVSRLREVREGDALCVDAPNGRVSLVPAAQAEDRLAAADAARAYEGLRDAPALERWLAASPSAARAAFLMEELVPRAVEGTGDEQLERLYRAALSAADSDAARSRVRGAARDAFLRARAAAREDAAGCAEDAADAASAEVLDRLVERSRTLARRVAAAGRVAGEGDGGVGAAAKVCAAVAERRRRLLPAQAVPLEKAAAAAGAQRPDGEDLDAGLWARFVSENRLGEFLERTAGDASLGLRRKSERVRVRILEGRVAAAAPFLPALVSGEDGAVLAPDAAAFPGAVKEAWAASWAPGPFGSRLRAGRGAAFEGRLRALRVVKAEAEGVAFSRDPGSGRRGRIIVESAGGDRYELDRRSGKPAAPARLASPGGKPALTAAQLAAVARLARGLDAWKGAGVELAFSISGGRLLLKSARALEPPRPIQPLLDPFSPRPSAEALDVRPVR